MNFKKITSLILGVTMFTSLCSCNKNPSQQQSSSSTSGEISETNHDLDSFDLEKYLAPIWSGNVSYAESAFVRQNEQGKVDPIQLFTILKKLFQFVVLTLKLNMLKALITVL